MRLPFLISSRIRPTAVLRTIRRVKELPLGRMIVDWYDPGLIGKHIDYTFRQKLALFRGKNFKLLLDLNDHIGYRTYIREEPFEQSVYRLGKKLGVGRDDVILDIGANIGTASIPICAETGCELIAIEASKPNAALLLQNAALNGIRVQAHILALTAPSTANQFIPLYLREGNRGANSLLGNWSPSAADKNCEMVLTKTLDDILTDHATINRIKIVKVDIEGAEWGMVQGARRFLARNTAPILMEYRSDAMDSKLAKEFVQLVEFMLENYDVCGLDADGHQVGFDLRGSYENIMFTRKASPTTGVLATEAAN